MDALLEMARDVYRLAFGAEAMLSTMLVGAILFCVLVYLLTRRPKNR
jgi:hypothetical protein